MPLCHLFIGSKYLKCRQRFDNKSHELSQNQKSSQKFEPNGAKAIMLLLNAACNFFVIIS